jgi:hypothetical protein
VATIGVTADNKKEKTSTGVKKQVGATWSEWGRRIWSEEEM